MASRLALASLAVGLLGCLPQFDFCVSDEECASDEVCAGAAGCRARPGATDGMSGAGSDAGSPEDAVVAHDSGGARNSGLDLGFLDSRPDAEPGPDKVDPGAGPDGAASTEDGGSLSADLGAQPDATERSDGGFFYDDAVANGDASGDGGVPSDSEVRMDGGAQTDAGSANRPDAGPADSGPQPWLWYDLSVTSSIDVVDGRVAMLRDLSGNGRHLTEVSASGRPSLEVSGGRWRARFMGYDRLAVTIGATRSPSTVLAAIRPARVAHALAAFGLTTGSAFGQGWCVEMPYGVRLGPTEQWARWTVADAAGVTHVDTVAPALEARDTLVGVLDRVNARRFLIDGAYGVRSAEMRAPSGASVFTLGGCPLTNTGFTGDVMEVRIYSTALSAEEMAAVEEEMAQKWGLTLRRSLRALNLSRTAHVAMGDAFPLEAASPHAWSAWIKPAGRGCSIVERMDGGAGYRLDYVDLPGGPHLRYRIAADATRAVEVATPVVLDDGAWHHVVVSNEGAGQARAVSLHVDGRLTTSAVQSDNLGGASTASAGTLRAGGGCDMIIDEVSAWHTAMNDADVRDAYGTGRPSLLDGPNLVSRVSGWWRMGEAGNTPMIPNERGMVGHGGISGASHYVFDVPLAEF